MEATYTYLHMNWGDYGNDFFTSSGGWYGVSNFTWQGDTYDSWLHAITGIQP